MNSKLTISIDEEIVLKAKDYARKNKRSLSALIENYLKLIVKDKNIPINNSLDIKKLKGSIRLPDNVDYKTVLENCLNQKYGK